VQEERLACGPDLLYGGPVAGEVIASSAVVETGWWSGGEGRVDRTPCLMAFPPSLRSV
jgi:hypothetical protein